MMVLECFSTFVEKWWFLTLAFFAVSGRLLLLPDGSLGNEISNRGRKTLGEILDTELSDIRQGDSLITTIPNGFSSTVLTVDDCKNPKNVSA